MSAEPRGIGGHQRPYRGRSDDWITPKEVLDALGPFDLDPCASETQPWPTARVMYRASEGDGLTRPWFGRVWLNPPYGPETGRWLARLVAHGDGVALIFARTETEMFHRYVWGAAQAVLFLEGRLHFHHPDGRRAEHNGGGPSCLVAYGARNVRALYESGLRGAVR